MIATLIKQAPHSLENIATHFEERGTDWWNQRCGKYGADNGHCVGAELANFFGKARGTDGDFAIGHVHFYRLMKNQHPKLFRLGRVAQVAADIADISPLDILLKKCGSGVDRAFESKKWDNAPSTVFQNLRDLSQRMEN